MNSLKLSVIIKPVICIIILFFSSSIYGQTEERKIVKTESKSVIMKGSDVQKMLGSVTDKLIYDEHGKIIDSLEADKMVKTFKYTLGFGLVKGLEGMRRKLSRFSDARWEQMDSISRKSRKPQNIKIQEGMTLDLKPLSKRVELDELKSKTVILIFWCRGCYVGSGRDAYASLNDVLLKYKNPEKFRILVVTHHSYDEAAEALKVSPIVNDQHIYNASQITEAYETRNRPHIIMTDQNHKIIYSVTDNAMSTPRTVDKFLKAL
ncbi:MAG: hypothetical protein V4687_11400 [Bacteroidota bacterium]